MISNIKFTDNPKHGVVRAVRAIRNRTVTSFLKSYSTELSKLVAEDKDFDVNGAMVYLLKEHPDEFMEFQKDGEEADYICAISLATDKIWTMEELDEFSFNEVEELYEKSKEVLGGDIDRFFGKFLSNPQIATPVAETPKPVKKTTRSKPKN